ncbi:hypothetical protein [Streptomyces flavofungini]|uniref:Integral membrane protein n=1 Tax=Streptomyces flavofungini TaxID=68200 RepID=A0ABS0XA73_9ACTN|nr:hypothetical protein [Streptomyces flavofungini]MBJ3809869.1 hypothetical protein [Streptomyces flavofungini]GHC54438.1 hypothetical protein GCM10010349_21020 [Streptomyces flavofungini]
MHSFLRVFLLGATRVLLIAFLLGGLVVVAGQIVALAAGDPHLMTLFGTDVTEVVCVIAGAAGACSFLLLYVRERGPADGAAGGDDGAADERKSVWD